MKVNFIDALVGREKSAKTALEKCRLEKKSLACTLRVVGHAHVKVVNERLRQVCNIFDTNIRDFGCAQTLLDKFGQNVLALRRRIGFVNLLLLCGEMSRVLNRHVAFECAVIRETQVGCALL